MDETIEFDGNKPRFISYYEHEAEIAREEKNVERHENHARGWRVACLIVFVAFVLSNVIWIYRETQNPRLNVTQETPSGNNNVIGRDGDINYGEPVTAKQ